jgi:hypothetical protein
MNLKNKPLGILFILVLLTGTAIHYAPRYLTYADKPVKSDAVILFLGSDDRKKEALHLLDEGYARFLIMPANRQVFTHKYIPVKVSDVTKHTTSSVFSEYPEFYENTHIEVLYAKKMMNAMGLKSAIMVSSPYHMKRIKIITERVFDSSYVIKLVPSRFEKGENGLRSLWYDLKNVLMESLKILWFLCYDLWGGG